MTEFNSTPRLIKRATVPAPTPHTQTKLKRASGARLPEDLDKPGQLPKDQFPFWAVWAMTKRAPRFRHPSEAAARAEAERLAALYSGIKFFYARVEGVVLTPTAALVEATADVSSSTPDHLVSDRPAAVASDARKGVEKN